MKCRAGTIFTVALLAPTLVGASTGLAQAAPHALPYGSGNWLGAGWYIYSPAAANEQLEYGVYPTKEQCLSDKKRMSDESNAEMQSAGLAPLPDPYSCAYFGTQPVFDKS
jgi:hypothetical protein